MTGEWSLADRMQNFYHKKIINADIPTWEGQIPNALHLNIFTSYYYQNEITPNIFMYRKVKAILGTQRIAFETNFGVNYGVNVNDKISNPLYVNSDKLGIYFGLNPHLFFMILCFQEKGSKNRKPCLLLDLKLLG